MRFPITITIGEETIEETVGTRDVFAYEDHFRESFGALFTDRGIMVSGLYRAAWITLRARHGERRSFDAWVDDTDPTVVPGHSEVSVDPTGETPDRPAADSLVSPPGPESIPVVSAS